MLDQNTTTILSTLIGGLIAILGGMVANHLSQKASSSFEKGKLFHEKLEEMYISSNQIKHWSRLQIYNAFDRKELRDMDKAESNWDMEFGFFLDSDFWLSDISTQEPQCPIDHLNMLIDLYIPAAVNRLEKYRYAVNQLVLVQQMSSIDINQINQGKPGDTLSIICYYRKLFEKEHKELQSLLRELVKKINKTDAGLSCIGPLLLFPITRAK